MTVLRAKVESHVPNLMDHERWARPSSIALCARLLGRASGGRTAVAGRYRIAQRRPGFRARLCFAHALPDRRERHASANRSSRARLVSRVLVRKTLADVHKLNCRTYSKWRTRSL